MEIERKYLIKQMPDLQNYEYREIEQAYLCTGPVVRVRRENESYYMTYKGFGMMSRVEENLPLTKEAYAHLKEKADGNIIGKRRYLIPIEEQKLTIELDVFEKPFEFLVMAEVEFESEDQADAFDVPEWFGEEVTFDKRYHNSYMSALDVNLIKEIY